MADDLVRRFAISFPMMRTYTDPNGPFVLYSDYAALRAQLDEARKQAFEESAQIADQWELYPIGIAIAAAIRQRGESE